MNMNDNQLEQSIIDSYLSAEPEAGTESTESIFDDIASLAAGYGLRSGSTGEVEGVHLKDTTAQIQITQKIPQHKIENATAQPKKCHVQVTDREVTDREEQTKEINIQEETNKSVSEKNNKEKEIEQLIGRDSATNLQKVCKLVKAVRSGGSTKVTVGFNPDNEFQFICLKYSKGIGFNSGYSVLTAVLPKDSYFTFTKDDTRYILFVVKATDIPLVKSFVRTFYRLEFNWTFQATAFSAGKLKCLIDMPEHNCVSGQIFSTFLDRRARIIESDPVYLKIWHHNQYNLLSNLVKWCHYNDRPHGYCEDKLFDISSLVSPVLRKMLDKKWDKQERDAKPKAVKPFVACFDYQLESVEDRELEGRYRIDRDELQMLAYHITKKLLKADCKMKFLRRKWFKDVWTDKRNKYFKTAANCTLNDHKLSQMITILKNHKIIEVRKTPRANKYGVGINNPFREEHLKRVGEQAQNLV